MSQKIPLIRDSLFSTNLASKSLLFNIFGGLSPLAKFVLPGALTISTPYFDGYSISNRPSDHI